VAPSQPQLSVARALAGGLDPNFCTSSVHLAGSLAAVQSSLCAAFYLPPSEWAGVESITISSDTTTTVVNKNISLTGDNAFTIMSDIVVKSVNDLPSISLVSYELWGKIFIFFILLLHFISN
jgi:hypothetical protein